MATGMIPCEDGHAQERSLLGEVLPTLAAGDLLIMDRNLCVRDFLAGIGARRAGFICRPPRIVLGGAPAFRDQLPGLPQGGVVRLLRRVGRLQRTGCGQGGAAQCVQGEEKIAQAVSG